MTNNNQRLIIFPRFDYEFQHPLVHTHTANYTDSSIIKK